MLVYAAPRPRPSWESRTDEEALAAAGLSWSSAGPRTGIGFAEAGGVGEEVASVG